MHVALIQLGELQITVSNFSLQLFSSVFCGEKCIAF